MRQVNFKLVDGPCLTVTRNGDQLLFTPMRMTWPEPPQLFNGHPAHHLSFPLKPRIHGPNAGKYWVHLSYELPGGGFQHVEVAALNPEQFARGMERVAQGMLELWVMATVYPITLEVLAAGGLRVALPKLSLFALFDQALRKPRRTYEFCDKSFEGLKDHMEVGSPLALREPEYRDCRYLVAFDPDSGMQLSLNRPEPGSEDWSATLTPWHTDEQFIELIGQAFPTLWDHLYVIGRELQAKMNREKLLALRTGS